MKLAAELIHRIRLSIMRPWTWSNEFIQRSVYDFDLEAPWEILLSVFIPEIIISECFPLSHILCIGSH